MVELIYSLLNVVQMREDLCTAKPNKYTGSRIPFFNGVHNFRSRWTEGALFFFSFFYYEINCTSSASPGQVIKVGLGGQQKDLNKDIKDLCFFLY